MKLGLKNYLFVQSDLGGEALAGFYSLIMTCELHDINPQGYLADILIRLANGHPSSDIDSLLPWNWTADEDRLKVESSDEYIEQEYPAELLIEKLGLSNKMYYDPSSEYYPRAREYEQISCSSP